jgi:hypothetical protein
MHDDVIIILLVEDAVVLCRDCVLFMYVFLFVIWPIWSYGTLYFYCYACALLGGPNPTPQELTAKRLVAQTVDGKIIA